MVVYMKTDIGMVRKTNEDSLICLPPHLYVVADGMGGHAAGEIASRLATETIKEHIEKDLKCDNPQAILEAAIQEANRRIYETAKTKEECMGMGTTVTAVYIDDHKLYWGHVGDSRIYLIRNKRLQQLTPDHSLVWDLMNSGSITKEQADNHPQRNILTRALGTSPTVLVADGIHELVACDKLLLCTDGLTGMLSDQELLKIICDTEQDVKLAVEKLITAANLAGGSDNVTAILLKHGDV